MSYDFNEAESNSSNYELIPANTVAPLIMTIRPGSAGEGGWETESKSSDATYLNCEFAVLAGPFKGRKFWGNMVVSGGKQDENGNSIAANISRSTLRGILESSRKIKADDESEAAKAKRIVTSYGDFSAMEFVGKIGIETAKPGSGYEDKNKLLAPVPVSSPLYATAGTGAAKPVAVAAANKPAWAA